MAGIWVPLVRLEEIMGQAAAHALATVRGGAAVYVGQTPSADLVALCGDDTDAAKRLCVEYGGSDIVLPSVLIRPAPKKTRIAAMVEAGLGNAEIIREVGCTLRYVAEIRRDLGLTKSTKKRARSKRSIVVDMLKAGRAKADIAKACGCSPAYIQGVQVALAGAAQT